MSRFVSLLNRLEQKPACKGHSLATFLTYPMHQVVPRLTHRELIFSLPLQIPRYIITLHELLAHTPPDHVEKKSLENAREKLEDLSRQMHDEVSETENIRKNLAIERMIVEGCDLLLDVNQVFVRQGTLLQVMPDRQRSRLAIMKAEREVVRQCFLFSNHLIITTRTHGGRLHLLDGVGKISLAEVRLAEDPGEDVAGEEEASSYSSSDLSLSSHSDISGQSGGHLKQQDYHG